MNSRVAAPVTAVIAAAGSGERLGADGPKAFVPLAGRPLVEWSIAAMRAAPSVRSIVVACPPGHVHDFGDDAQGQGGHRPGDNDQSSHDEGRLASGDHEVGVVEGGATRAQSVANALQEVATELVAIHDAARPMVTPELVEGVVATLAADPEADGAIAATPVTDTIKRLAAGGDLPPPGTSFTLSPSEGQKVKLVIEETVDRGRLWAAQTPQVFRVEPLRRALAADPTQLEAATDEAMLIEAAGGRVLIHPAPPENLKVTTPLDLRLAELLLAERR